MNLNPIDTFLQEAEDLLAQIEEAAVDFDIQNCSEEVINQLFRAFHTIKGSGGMFGFNTVAEFTHHVESSLDQVRGGRLQMSSQLLNLILAARDHIKKLLDKPNQPSSALDEAGQEIISALQSLDGTGDHDRLNEEGEQSSNLILDSQTALGDLQTWRITFQPSSNLLACGMNPISLLNELRGLGECTVTARTDRIPTLEQIQPDGLYFWWEVTLTTRHPLDSIKDVFIFIEDECEIQIDSVKPLGKAVAVKDVATNREPLAVVRTKDIAGSKAPQKESTIRVPSDKLDRLVNLVGELVMNQSRLTQAASQVEAPGLAEPVEEIERLVSELRDNVLGIRMMPIGATFTRFKRLIHDLSAELGKEIEFVTEGAETELDKTVLDQLGDPLVHLIRNSIDHGIETAQERLEKGKPHRGTLTLSAVHAGSSVLVSIHDDGRGLDTERIRAKAIEKGLISVDAIVSEKEVFNLIFLPGFSTASQITNVSGRGVGMDVVKRQIEQLRGSISISSELHKGTTITLTLPLTLAIIDGLLVNVGTVQYIIPMSIVTENVELNAVDRRRGNSRNVIPVRGELIPYVQLRQVFDISDGQSEIEKIVIVQHDGQRVGLVVDRVLGSHQTVIQSIGKFYGNVKLFSGATIMGDGHVALIVDADALIRHVDEACQLRRAS